ncbi:MAG: class A beta-lactamase-related serine hydrolase [Alphaproteobacteria bacterium]|nr:class A beta-lactamase-related serine hydrolase [Alphaproteobacteria bacterium]
MAALPEIDRLLGDAVAAGHAPGIVAMAATADGPVYQGAFGRIGAGAAEPMTLDRVFWIASMTKAITSTAAMLLVERGQLDLDRPLASLLPELAAPQVLTGFTPAGEPELRPANRPITLRHLLTHTAGFGYPTWNTDLRRYQEKTGIPAVSSGLKRSLAMPLTFDPGERWQYGINTDWVGRAVEAASGEGLGAFLRANLFEPLGMVDTGFKLDSAHRARLAGMHARQADGSFEVMPFEVPQAPEFEMGGGGLYSTAHDYMAFMAMFLHGGRAKGVPILAPETVQLMAQNHIGDLTALPLRTAMPALSNDADFFPGMAKRWSLAFMLNSEAVPGRRGRQSLAWAGLRNTYFWIDPARRVAGVLLTQIIPFADPRVLDVFAAFETATYAELLPRPGQRV